LSNVKKFIQIIANMALGNFCSFGFLGLALSAGKKTNVLKCGRIYRMNGNGLAMLSCDNLALNFLSTKPTWKNQRFFQSSTDLSN